MDASVIAYLLCLRAGGTLVKAVARHMVKAVARTFVD